MGYRWDGCQYLTTTGHCAPRRGMKAARNARLFHECWRNFLSNWDAFSKKHRLVIYSDGIARESMHFIAGLLGDQQVYLVDISHLLYLLHIAYLSHLSSGGKPMHTACTLCTLCTLFKTGKTTENKTLEFRSRKGGDGIRPFKLRVIRRESLKLGRKGGAFNV